MRREGIQGVKPNHYRWPSTFYCAMPLLRKKQGIPGPGRIGKRHKMQMRSHVLPEKMLLLSLPQQRHSNKKARRGPSYIHKSKMPEKRMEPEKHTPLS